MFGCNTHLLKHIKQAILAWSFRQNIILGCFPVFAAISARDEFIVCYFANNNILTSYFYFRELSAMLVMVRVSLTNPGRHRKKKYKDVGKFKHKENEEVWSSWCWNGMAVAVQILFTWCPRKVYNTFLTTVTKSIVFPVISSRF